MSKKRLFRFFNMALIVLVLSGSFNTAFSDESGAFYIRETGKGYYWYEKLSESIEDEPELPEYAYEELWNLHPDEFQAHLNALTKTAVQYPTPENVEKYLMAQDVARRKAAAFASVVSMVGQQNPEYGTEDVYPTTAPGRKAAAEMKEREYERVIQGAKDEFALIMFSRYDCGFCDAQKSILKYFDNKYQWPIRIVDISMNSEFASGFNVEITPTIILAHKSTKDYLLVSSGVISMENLERRLFRSVRYMRGDISAEQWATFEFERNSGHDPMKFIKED